MDHTGESGESAEYEDDLEIVAELVDDELDEVEVVDEIRVVETDDAVDELEVVDVDEAEEPIDELEAEAEAVDDAVDEPVHAAVDPVEEPRDDSRHRHPANASMRIAKRVAMDRSARIAVGSLVLVAFLFLFVFPTRSYLAQQRQVRDARHSVQVLRTQNAQLAAEAQRLQTPSEIKKLARSQFNMVFPGEEAYNVVPPRGTVTTTTVP